MDKLKYFLLVDPIQTLEKGSHNGDVDWFIKNFLDEESIAFDRGFALKECKSKHKSLYRIGTLFKLALIASANAFKATKLARRYDLTVFNPNEDPISLFILQKIRNIARSNFAIKSRFICTRDRILLEKNSIFINHLKIGILASVRYNDKISAETITYSEFLSREFGIKIEFVPHPPIDIRFNHGQINRNCDLYVALGAARKDKGFETLPAWINSISKVNPRANFVIQAASREWLGYDKVLESLSKVKKVQILPSYIDERSQYEILSSAFAVLAPYDQATYQLRGSAFTRRAMYLGKLLCVSPETSMSMDAAKYNLLISPESPVNDLNTSYAHQNRKTLGLNLQYEAIQIWRNFLL
jgi:hypothetical protein